MELKLDVKTLVIGIVLGVIITAALGAVGSADKTDFGLAVAFRGSAIVRADDGSLYVVNSENGMATRVMQRRNLSSDPDDSRTAKGRIFNLSAPAPVGRPSTGY
ncbi:MAG: hypothetical protein ACYS0C_07290 [Planctomycetota bacterium]|jgi:hypothetical protein